MAPDPTPLVVQFIQFYANDQCTADPSLFRALREKVQQGWQDKGLIGQYWGPSVDKVDDLYWLILWESHERATAFKADPLYPTIAQENEALATKPVYEVHVCSARNPLRAIQAPVTEVDFYKARDEDEAKPVAVTQDMIRGAIDLIETLPAQGFVAISWGMALEDGRRGLTLAGWDTVEDHMRMGTLEEHKDYVEHIEAIFSNLSELHVAHVSFKSHDAVPPV